MSHLVILYFSQYLMSDPNIAVRKEDLKAQIKSIKNRIDSDYLRLLEISQVLQIDLFIKYSR